MPDGSIIIPLIINILIVSIPEETFLTVCTLILMNRYDLIEPKKGNILRIASIVLPIAFMSDILRGFVGMDLNIMPFLAMGMLFFLILLVYRIKTSKGILKAFVSTCISFVIIIILQMMFFPLISATTNITAEMLNKPGIIIILVTLPERILEAVIITLFVVKKRSFTKLGLFKVFSRNPLLAYISGGIVFMNLLFVYIMIRLIYLDRILNDLNMILQIIVISIIILFPILNMTVLLGVINYSVNKLMHTKVYIQEESKVLRVLVKLLLEQERYKDIDAHLDSFIEEVKKIK